MSRIRFSLLCAAALGTGCLLRVSAQQQPAAPIERQTPPPAPVRQQAAPYDNDDTPELQRHDGTMTLTVAARAVVLDVVVTDGKGHPVKGLTAADFTLREDGVPQTLKSFEEHGPMSAAELAKIPPPLPPNTFTNYVPFMNSNAYTVILLDSLDTPIVDQMYAHEQVLEYMKHVPAGTPIAIFDLDTRMRLVQGFTTDPQMLLDAVKSKRSNPRLESIPGYLPRLRYEVLRDGMQTLGRYLAGFPGRKNLIWFTSFTNETLGGSGSNNAFHDSSSFVDDMTGTTDVLTLSRVAVYPIDPRGVSLHSTAFSDEYLDDFARRTGGRAFYSDNDLKGAVAEVVNTGSNYYTISYTPSNRNWNGERRKIELQVSGSGVGPHTTLQYRRSYVARSRQATELRHLAALKKKTSQGKFMTASESQPNGQQGVLLARGPQETLQRSMSLGSIAPTEIVFGASLKPAPTVEKLQKNAPPPPDNYMRPEFAKKPFRNYDILYAVNARQLQLTPTPDGLWHDSVEYVAVVYDDAGNVVNSLITTVQMNVKDATYRRMMANGFGMTQQIAVPTKGNYFLRVGVHDVDGDRVGALEIPMDEVKLGVAGAGQMLTP